MCIYSLFLGLLLFVYVFIVQLLLLIYLYNLYCKIFVYNYLFFTIYNSHNYFSIICKSRKFQVAQDNRLLPACHSFCGVSQYHLIKSINSCFDSIIEQDYLWFSVRSIRNLSISMHAAQEADCTVFLWNIRYQSKVLLMSKN